jgi:hypothetical protein
MTVTTAATSHCTAAATSALGSLRKELGHVRRQPVEVAALDHQRLGALCAGGGVLQFDEVIDGLEAVHLVGQYIEHPRAVDSRMSLHHQAAKLACLSLPERSDRRIFLTNSATNVYPSCERWVTPHDPITTI